MKRKLLLFWVAVALSATVLASPVSHKKMYGFFLNNQALSGYGYSEFYMDDLDNATLIYPYSNSVGIFAGACADNVFYACEYVFNQYGPQASNFIAYDLVTGKKTEIGPWTDETDVSLKLQDMTYDYTTQTMYAVGYQYGESALYTMNLTTGQLTKVAPLATICGTIAANKKGELYVVGTNGKLYLVNKKDGALAEICDTHYKGMASNQSMEFDRSNGLLYWASCTISEDDGRDTYMLQIDLSKDPVEITNIGVVGIYSALLSLYIPFVEGGDDAPAAPTEVKVTPDANGKLSATISWKNPMKTFAGNDLDHIKSVVVLRNNEPVATIDATEPGAEMTYTDIAMEKDGPCRYSIYAVNEAGEGEHGEAFAYVGHDWPGNVGNMTVTVDDGCASATLTWSPADEGFNGGYFDPEGQTYKIVRMPDETTLVEGLTDNTFTDKSARRLGRYSYTVTACNQYGESETKVPGTYVLGNALDLPVSQDFSDLTYFLNQWQAVDANNDGFTWTYYSPYGYYQFGNTLVCVEYMLNPTVGMAEQDADEWLITPPMKFEADKVYQVRVNARSISTETLDVTLGCRNTVEAQSVVGSMTVEPTSGEPMPTTDYIVRLPEGIEGVNCIGLHLNSTLPLDNYSYLQIAGITIEEAAGSGICNVNAEEQVECHGHNITLPECSEKTTVYDVAGRKLTTTCDRTISTANLTEGVYLLRVTMTGGRQKTFKIHVSK